MKNHKKWKTLKSEFVFDNPWLKVRKDAVETGDGTLIEDYYLWDNPKSNVVIPVTDEGALILVRQYKHGVGLVQVEFPGGLTDEGESVQISAERELLEETGYRARKFTYVSKISLYPSKMTSVVEVFLAEGLEKIAEISEDVGECIEVLELGNEEIAEMIRHGEIISAETIAAFYIYEDFLKRNTKIL